MRIVILVVVLLVHGIPASSQSLSDTLRLDDIVIEATRVPEPRKLQPVQIQIIDSLQLKLSGASSLAQVLESHSSLFIRNYGPAGVSTISQRGMLSHQTQIYWNGFNLNHPMLGLFDLNMFSVGMLSSILVNSAGSSSYGSGNMGGNIQLITEDTSTGATVSQSAGSFGRYQSSARAGVSQDNWDINVQAMLDHSQNDFPYYDYSRNPGEERIRDNNRVETRGALASGSYKLTNSTIRSGLWYSHSERGVPGTMLSPTPRAHQEDEFIRWYGDYQITRGQVATGAKLYLNRQELNFIDPGSNTRSLSTNSLMTLEIPVTYEPTGSIRVNGVISTSDSQIESTAYNANQGRQHRSVQVNPSISPVSGLKLYPAIRYDHYSEFGHALSYAVGANYSLIQNKLHWRAYASSDFNAPTFNDLYWPDSGNPNLQPEEGWKLETGFFSMLHHNAILQETDGQVFISRLRNGIQWLPLNGVHRPQNIREIHAKGFELQSHTTYLHSRYQLRMTHLLNGTWSSYGEPRFPGDQATGNQLVHTPVMQYRVTGSVFTGPVNILATHRWAGQRFTDENNFNTIGAFSAADLTIAYTLELQMITGEFQWNINNLFNSTYEVMPYYPIPGRSHLFTVRLTI